MRSQESEDSILMRHRLAWVLHSRNQGPSFAQVGPGPLVILVAEANLFCKLIRRTGVFPDDKKSIDCSKTFLPRRYSYQILYAEH